MPWTKTGVLLGPPPSNMVTTDSDQSIAGVKTLTSGRQHLTAAAEPATPVAGMATLFAIADQNNVARIRVKHSDGSTSAIRAIEPYVMAVTGALTVQTGKSRVYLEDNYTVESIRASVSTAPAGAAVIVDVNRNGTTLFTTQAARPAIAAGAFTATGAPAVTTFAAGDYLTVDVDQIGTTTAGSDLTVVIRLRRN